MEKFEYKIQETKRGRKIRLIIKHTGEIIVTKPYLTPNALVVRFIDQHKEWIDKNLKRFKKRPIPLLSGKSKKDYIENKERSRALVHDRINYWNKDNRYSIGTIRIGNQKSRWGSCSKKGNLNFNYKVIYLPKEVLDYVIVHELCHLVHLNHSRAFWSLVESQIPNWSALRKELKKY
ncbi:MAG: M48 family metallopeptidase [Candidatus Pacebacteria bacterium]|nr:M48 family metallopeptidase [Candidatus Paceibacterota bacterium]